MASRGQQSTYAYVTHSWASGSKRFGQNRRSSSARSKDRLGFSDTPDIIASMR